MLFLGQFLNGVYLAFSPALSAGTNVLGSEFTIRGPKQSSYQAVVYVVVVVKIGQAHFETIVIHTQGRVIQFHQLENRRMEIVKTNLILTRAETYIIGSSNHLAFPNSPAYHPANRESQPYHFIKLF